MKAMLKKGMANGKKNWTSDPFSFVFVHRLSDQSLIMVDRTQFLWLLVYDTRVLG